MANIIRSLEEAAVSGDLDGLYAAIQTDPYILEHVDAMPFVDTPLHIAASSMNLKNHPYLHFKYLHFITEIMRLKPSFALKLNPQGFSPIHLALQNGHTKLVHRFVDINKDLVRMKGREGITPLHFVCQTGDSELLAYFLSVCPDSIEDITIKGETALHIAVKCKQFHAFQVLIGWLIRHVRMDAWTFQRSILNSKDEEGNTILHLSALSNDIQALDLLAKSEMVNLNAKNSEGLTALDKAGSRESERKLMIAGAKHGSRVKDDGSLAEQARRKIRGSEQLKTTIKRLRRSISDKQRDTYLVVAALVLGAMFQSALSPPGGLYQATDSNTLNNNATSSSLNSTATPALPKYNNNAGKSVLSGNSFLILSQANAGAVLLTAQTFLFLVPAGRVAVSVSVPIVYFVVIHFYSLLLISPSRGTTHQIIAFIIMILVMNLYGLVFLAWPFNFRSSKFFLRQIVLGRKFQ